MDAILPLIGVVIGAFLGAGMTFLLDRRHEQRASRAALRLVIVELREAQGTWNWISGVGMRDPSEGDPDDAVVAHLQEHPVQMNQWTDHHKVLASSLPPKDWEELTKAYEVIRMANQLASETRGAGPEGWLTRLLESQRPILDEATRHLARRTAAHPSEPSKQ